MRLRICDPATGSSGRCATSTRRSAGIPRSAAHAGTADVFTLLALYGFVPLSEAAPRAITAVKRALLHDPHSAEAYTARAKLADETGDWPLAEQSYRRALELRPGHAAAHHWYGMHLVIRGRTAEGVAALKRAVELDPLARRRYGRR